MKYSVNAQGVPDAIGPYSQGTTAGRLVFAAGQIPVAEGETERLVEGGIREQTDRVIDLIEKILAEVGCTLADVARTTVYLRDLSDLEGLNEVYSERFGTPAPARSVVAVSDIPLGALVEMDCVACR